MRVDKVIMRAALSTLTAIIVLFVAMILMLCFLFPWTMMQLTYDLGMDGASVRSAKRAYNMSGEVYYVAFATDVAIGCGDDEKIVECGKMLIADENFKLYCEEKTAQTAELGGVYDQYVYGQVCLAQYRQGDKEGAIATAFSSLDGAFEKNNAVAALLVTALSTKDSDTVDEIQLKMNEMQSQISQENSAYFQEMLTLAQNG
jgi:hypothetical protein